VRRERIGAGHRAPTDPCYDHGDRLNELWIEWLNMVLELKLDAVVRGRPVRHSGGTNILNMESWLLRCLAVLRRLCGSVTGITFLRPRFGLVQKESQKDVAKIWSRFLWSRNAVQNSCSGRRG
jgi:hypothetical protein